MAPESRSLPEALFCHLVLPPQLPGERDPNIIELESEITTRLERACKSLRKIKGSESANVYVPIERTLGLCKSINRGHLEKHSLIDAFSKLENSMVLILHLAKQNAAILVRRIVSNSTDMIIWEAFETSASTESVLAAEGALQWDFPGRAVEIPYGEFEKQSFQEELAIFLEKASTESLERFEAHVIKAGVSISEGRDTPEPAMIIQFLMPLLEAIGNSIKPQTLRKRVRDDVNMCMAKFPWRRLPHWLILKVATQRQLCLNLGNEAGQFYYKLLICEMLSEFLLECSGKLAPEMTMMLVAKIGRRLAKLEKHKDSMTTFDNIQMLFSVTSSRFRKIIQKVKNEVSSAWNNYKQTNLIRKIPYLPTTAQDADFVLSLTHSGAYLDHLINLPNYRAAASQMTDAPLVTNVTIQKFQEFTDIYRQLATLENEIEEDHSLGTLSEPGVSGCVHLGLLINKLFDRAEIAYKFDSEQTSLLILNIFTCWMEMDQIAVTVCPILFDYHPLFSPALLDALQLPILSSMRRLQKIQLYLKDRCNRCTSRHTIFSEPATQESFAVRYVNGSVTMQRKKFEIQQASDRARAEKESEWARVGYQYDELTEIYESRLCLCTWSLNEEGESKRTLNGCSKCPKLWDRQKLSIYVHEDFLPNNEARACEAVFQLNIPSWFALYRDATWRIAQFAYSNQRQPCMMPVQRLEDYSQLKSYANSGGKTISLASTKKSFLETHFKDSLVKSNLSKVLLPLALEFSMFDYTSNMWVKDMNKPLTFQLIVGVHIPPALRQEIMKSSRHPPPNAAGPSSYEIIASQTKCTSETSMSVYEVMAYQKLLYGAHQRWINILVELGSQNLNFSSVDTMQIISQLAIQAGSASDDHNIFRDSHLVFQDSAFCRRLAEQIESRIQNIAVNWREVNSMEMLITLALRMFALTSGVDRERAKNLLALSRGVTINWISIVRLEVRQSGEAMEKVALYGLWAALLCRRTFNMYWMEKHNTMGAEDISLFIRSSIALQEHLVVDLSKLPQVLKRVLVRDVKMTCEIQSLVEEAILSNPDVLSTEINLHWLEPDRTVQRRYSRWHVCILSMKRWLASTMRNSATGTYHQIFYNFVDGHLLVDGKVLERLPLAIRESQDVQELFGNQHLFTFPSSLPGMSYCMQSTVVGGTIHFGLRGAAVVIKAFTLDGELEFIPRTWFGPADDQDLPSDLVDDCFHWLHLETGVLEIRRKPEIWEAKKTEWIVDVPSRSARRGKTELVDPRSSLCQSINTIFSHFEDKQKLTVCQAMEGPLTVQLRMLDLSFTVRKNGLLKCHELRSEIDPNQDAGTLYGFESKIVLRDVANPEHRILIVALGELVSERKGMHVSVTAGRTPQYGKFTIDSILGRLTCQPEPRLLYSKARLHAFTSFVLPDPLTQRTGTEEAIHALQSASSHPWMPIAKPVLLILKSIQRLSPSREYYPKDKRRMQSMVWRQDLTTTIQHDSYDYLVQKIEETSENLSHFSSGTERSSDSVYWTSSHLRNRGRLRRQRFEREIEHISRADVQDTLYKPRDRDVNLKQGSFVYHVVKLLRAEEFSSAMMKQDLPEILQSWDMVGGFNIKSSPRSSLYDLTETKISQHFGSLIQFCQSADNHFSVAFRLGLLSLSGADGESSLHKDAIVALVAFSRLNELKQLKVPDYPDFTRYAFNERPTLQLITNLIAEDYPAFKPRRGLTVGEHGIAEKQYKLQRDIELEDFADYLLQQWPRSQLSWEGFPVKQLNVTSAMEKIELEWQRMLQNMELNKFLVQVQTVLGDYKAKAQLGVPAAWAPIREVYQLPRFERSIIPSFSLDCLTNPGASLIESDGQCLLANPTRTHTDASSVSVPSLEIVQLRQIFENFALIPNDLRKQYAETLNNSLDSYEKTLEQARVSAAPPTINEIKKSVTKAQIQVQHQLLAIRQTLFTQDSGQRWLDLANLLPCASPITVLEQLRSISDHNFGPGMKESLICYGKLITYLQKLLRMQDACLRKDRSRLQAEFGNIGHENWDPCDYPDWLLLEIDGDIMIRSVQVEVAKAIISPKSNYNSVLQMNMGQGKTSTILPMVAAFLANKKQLTRLIVIKPLLMQTAQSTLVKLGGLVGRVVRSIPFSRRTKTNEKTLELYRHLHNEILESGGVLLSTPEYIMSFKLSGEQKLIDAEYKEAKRMIEDQSWLTSSCRDVLDESDFTLAVQRQLIYPSGQREFLDGNPHRWLVAQSLLSLVENYLPDLVREFPQGIEVVERANGFPIMHILDTKVEQAICERIIDDICMGHVELLRPNKPPGPGLDADIRHILTAEVLQSKAFNRVYRLYADREAIKAMLLTVRGFLKQGILVLCLSNKRWNVNYGLHPSRPPLAVPYENKGIPSEQAEFGFPEVAILLTCLAFYYSGLDRSQFTESLRIVLKSDDPAAEYERWSYGSENLPSAFHHWDIINVDDDEQMQELWSYLRVNRSVLNHFMNYCVFPIHAKQFGKKLQASAWDIPLFNQSARQDEAAKTTGFSGTNDNKNLLPLTIRQNDLPSLAQTSAEVLTYLLQPRNRSVEIAAAQGKRLTGRGLLKKLTSMKIKVLIDAGAYILEKDNQSLAREWLDIDRQAKAAVYFGKDNRAWVVSKGGKKIQPLLATSFADNLSDCLVYLDEAHVRGIDLRLGSTSRGALTLALLQTKDHTVQAAMRLRQLATSQSVVFFAPPDVHRSILDVCQKSAHDEIDSSDVVAWLLEQTCCANEHFHNLYIAQGRDFCSRMNAKEQYPDILTRKAQLDAYLPAIVRHEVKTLKELYASKPGDKSEKLSLKRPTLKLKQFNDLLNKMQSTVGSKGPRGSALEEVEQEREIQLEVEDQRAIEKPKHFKALQFPGLHKSISTFVETGLLEGGRGYEQAFAALKRTSIGKSGICQSDSQLFVSNEFMRTIVFGEDGPNDNFLRSVEYILWCPAAGKGLIIIPEEAELLIPKIRALRRSKVHLVAYAAPVTKTMSIFNTLTYYTIPELPKSYVVPKWLSLDLGIFSGRLYLDFDECVLLAEYLKSPGIPEGGDSTSKKSSGRTFFTANPTDFLLEWLNIRRKGQNFMHTPVGQICHGKVLTWDHSFFRSQPIEDIRAVTPTVQTGGRVNGSVTSDDDDSGNEGNEEADEEEFTDAE